MKRYERYKPTGIAWLPEIPEHWEEKRIATKFIGHIEQNSDFEFPRAFKFNYGSVVPKNEAGTPEEYREVYVKYSKVKRNDIIINGLNLNYDFVSQRIAIVPEPGIITSAYVVLRPFETTFSPYFSYLFKAMDSQKLFHGMGTGIRLTLSFDELKKQIIPIPPIAEQQKIVAFLDKRITLIEECKCKRERELQTLNELRQAEIASVVTRGFNPDVPMKDSGIPWIGQIPAHWELRRFKTICSLIREPAKSGDKKVALENIESNTGKYIKTNSVFEGEGIHFEVGDVLFGKLRPYLAKVYLAKEPAQAVGDFYVFRANNSVLPEFLQKIVISSQFIGVVNAGTYGTKMPRASWQDIAQLYVPVPPIEEQNAIVEYIESKTHKIDTMIEALKAEIDRLTEYKQRLISDVVTGQTDVRDE